MKKTWFALLLAVVMLASMFVGCTQKPAEKPVEAAPVVTEAPKPTEAPKEEPKPTEEPAPEPTAEPKLESEPEPEGLHKLVVLNTLVKDIETVKSEDSRFNAYWLPSYKLGEIFEKNFWFVPEANEVVAVTAYSDGYTDDGTDSYETLCAKGIPFGFTDSKGGTYDVFTGSTQKMNAMVQYMGYILTGHECALFMPDDGWENLKELFDEIKMAPAESYDFICADDYTEEIAAADLENCKIYATENGTIDATSIAYPGYGLTSIRYIVPHGMTKESEPVEGICQIVVMPNAEGVLDTEPAEDMNYGGTLYAAYPVADVLAKAGIETTTAKAISYKDGYIFNYDIDTFMKVYICLDTKNKNDAFTCGKAQVRDQLCKAAGQYIFDDAALVYVPGVEVMPDGYSVTDLFKTVGMVEAKAYKFICADGWAEEIDAEDLAEVKIFINAAGDGVDATSIAYPDYTLMNILEITPVA